MPRAAIALLLLIGCDCGEGASSTQPGDPAARDVPAPDPPPPSRPVPAFLVYGSEHTMVIPIDGSEPRTADGIWIAPIDRPRTVVHRFLPSDPVEVGLPPCACGTIDRACIEREMTRTIEVNDGFAVEWEGDCACWGTQDSIEWPEEPEYPFNAHGESLAPCHEQMDTDPVVSVVSGRAYTANWGSPMNAPCALESASTNAYDLWGLEQVLVDVEVAELPRVGAVYGCDSIELNLERAVRTMPGCTDEDEDDYESRCYPDRIDIHLPALRNGQWCDVGAGVGAAGEWAMCARCVRVTPSVCPSALDPCGPEGAYAAMIESADHYWVATDGEHALAYRGPIGSIVASIGTATAVEAPIQPDLGVLYHPDASGILLAMAHDYADVPEEESEVCDSDSDCSGGQLCMNEECHSSCETDDDCDRRGHCGARCREGRCGALPDGECSGDFPCGSIFVCGPDGACHGGDGYEEEWDEGGESTPVGDCAMDSDCGTGMCVGDPPRCQAPTCEGERTAREWAAECSRQRRADEMAAAATTCRCALEAADEPRVRGAVLYELGRLAEGLGSPSEARTYYRRSLEARPNDIVETRLRHLDE